jgi:hypothetical protein
MVGDEEEASGGEIKHLSQGAGEKTPIDEKREIETAPAPSGYDSFFKPAIGRLHWWNWPANLER